MLVSMSCTDRPAEQRNFTSSLSHFGWGFFRSQASQLEHKKREQTRNESALDLALKFSSDGFQVTASRSLDVGLKTWALRLKTWALR